MIITPMIIQLGQTWYPNIFMDIEFCLFWAGSTEPPYRGKMVSPRLLFQSSSKKA